MTELGFWSIARAEPDRLALVDPDENQISFGALLAEANRLVHGLRSLGMEAGDGIAVDLPNGIEMYALYLAAMQAGWYFTPINWHLVGPEVAYIVNDCEASVFVGHERFADACEAAADEIELPSDRLLSVGEAPGYRSLTELTEGQPDRLPDDRTAGGPMHYTSGTTGRPKGVRRPLSGASPEEAFGGGFGLLAMFGIRPHDDNVHICGSPLYHTAVLAFSSGSMHIGHTVVLMDRWDAEQMLHLIDSYRVTHSHMVPTQFHRLLALPDEVRSRYDVSSLRAVIHAAAPCPVETKRQMLDWWGPVIYEYYAATEGGGTLVTPQEWLERPGTVGKAWPGAELRVVDDEGRDLPPGEVGTVYMRMGRANFEYFKDEKKTEESRLDEFFTVGDVGFLDEDGYLFLRDRKSDMIISGGVNIYPAEIESVLVQHPKVHDVAVFGIPHPDWGEEIKAVVQPVDGVRSGDGLTGEILEFARERLARFKLPRSVDYIDEMPRDPNGKLYKRRLRDPYWVGREAAI